MFRNACVAKDLLEGDKEWQDTMKNASIWDTPNQLVFINHIINLLESYKFITVMKFILKIISLIHRFPAEKIGEQIYNKLVFHFRMTIKNGVFYYFLIQQIFISILVKNFHFFNLKKFINVKKVGVYSYNKN